MRRRRKARLPLLLSHFHSFCLCLCLHLIDSVSVFWQSAFPSKQRRESDHSYIRADRQRHRHTASHTANRIFLARAEGCLPNMKSSAEIDEEKREYEKKRKHVQISARFNTQFPPSSAIFLIIPDQFGTNSPSSCPVPYAAMCHVRVSCS